VGELVLNSAYRDEWQVLSGFSLKEGFKFEGTSYTNLISVDDVEKHVTSSVMSGTDYKHDTLSKLTYAIICAVSTYLLNKSKDEERLEQEDSETESDDGVDVVVEFDSNEEVKCQR
jgi:hypothetical protein